MSLRDQLQAIYDERGLLTPQLVLDEARDPDHPLHTRFVWDDAVAAERYRLEQAHELIQSVKVVYKKGGRGGERSVRAYQAVRSPAGYAYRPTEEVARDELATEIVLRDMERDWKQLKARYGHFQEFVQLIRSDVGEEAA